jgi:hypothetical protein
MTALQRAVEATCQCLLTNVHSAHAVSCVVRCSLSYGAVGLQEDGTFALEDEAGSVAVDLTGAKAAAGLVTGEPAAVCAGSVLMLLLHHIRHVCSSDPLTAPVSVAVPHSHIFMPSSFHCWNALCTWQVRLCVRQKLWSVRHGSDPSVVLSCCCRELCGGG